MTNLFEPPPKYTLPLAKGGDLVVDFLNDPDNDENYVDYDAGVTVTLVIDTDTPIEAEAEITDHHAVVKIESAVADEIPSNTVWRLIHSSPTTPSTETVAAYGKTKRFDA
jgi:hypothetical protein